MALEGFGQAETVSPTQGAWWFEGRARIEFKQLVKGMLGAGLEDVGGFFILEWILLL